MASVVRTRIAPSPTGFLHVGTARAALFSELFARSQDGQFIIRIEDTDQMRSRPEFETDILEGLRWLGLTWEEGPDTGGPYGPYRQSERTHIYREAIEQLLESGAAYLDGSGKAVRLRVAPQNVTFTDLVRGKITVDAEVWGGDFVIARALDDPVFHLAVVVDDAAMEITHVIRGEDHITNTGRHILLQQALGYPTPQYAHLPLLLDDQRRKLSKRTNEVSLLAYRDLGYLPEAMLNYLALLGWSPKDDTEFFTHAELAARFSLAGVQRGGAIFSEDKLQAVNKHYLRQLAPEELLRRAQPFLKEAGYDLGTGTPALETYWSGAAVTEQERIATLGELPDKLKYFKTNWAGEYSPELLIWKESTPQETFAMLKKLQEFISGIDEIRFTESDLQKILMDWIDETGQGRGDILWPMRVALTGLDKSPGPFEVAAVLGKRAVLMRIKAAADRLKNTYL